MDFPPTDTRALAGFFAGRWSFVRTIWEGGDAPQAQAEGACEFAAGPGDGRLAYREQGRLRMLAAPAGSRPIPFTRLFDYRFDEGGVQVLFADGERVGLPYQRYELRGNLLAPAAEHICGPDCYTAAYTLDGPDGFTLETFISGPKKRTRLLTRYRRLSDAA
jgi:hypothetical protein